MAAVTSSPSAQAPPGGPSARAQPLPEESAGLGEATLWMMVMLPPGWLQQSSVQSPRQATMQWRSPGAHSSMQESPQRSVHSPQLSPGGGGAQLCSQEPGHAPLQVERHRRGSLSLAHCVPQSIAQLVWQLS